jgi:hypothetical protein
MIQPVESLEITVLVDNETDSLSTNPGFVKTELAGAWRRGMKPCGGPSPTAGGGPENASDTEEKVRRP